MSFAFNPDIPSTIKEISDFYAKKQPHQVNMLLEETPVLSRLKFEQASHGLWNAYEEVSGVKGAGLVEMDAPLPSLGLATELRKMDLNIFGGLIEVGEDKARIFGGHAKWFARRMPSILRESGMAAEKNILCKNLRAYAVEHKNLALSAGGAGYSIIALRQIPGETMGLYSPEGFKQGAMFDTLAVNGGSVYKNAQGVLVYGLRIKAYFGYQIANQRSVGAIVNIDKDHLPTPAQIDDLLANIRATPASTLLLMHPRMLNYLNAYKAEKLQVDVGAKDMDRRFTHWNGIEILTSYNFEDGWEKPVTPR